MARRTAEETAAIFSQGTQSAPSVTSQTQAQHAASVARDTAASAAKTPSTYTGGDGNTYSNTSGRTVMTSSAATTNLDNIKKQHTDLVDGINNQAVTVANNRALEEAAAKVKAEQDSQAKAQTAKMSIDRKNAEAKIAATKVVDETQVSDKNPVIREKTYPGNEEWMTITRSDGTSEVVSKGADGSYVPVSRAEISLQSKKNEQTRFFDDYTTAADVVSKTIQNIQNGIIPLNPGEIAQVQGLEHSFRQLIDQQTLINKGAAGAANIRGYQKGAAEYDPTFQVNTIGAIVTAGANKIADLNIKMASAVAELTQGFKDDNIRAIKDSWDVYEKASTKRADALKKTIDDAQTQIKDAQTAKAKLEADQTVAMAKVQEDIDVVLSDASNNGAPPEVLEAIRNASTVAEAIRAAEGYTGDTLDRQLKAAQIEEARARTAKTLAEAAAESPEAKTAAATSEKLSLLSLADSIVESPYFDQVFGLKNPLTYYTPGSNEQLVKNQVKQLKGNLALEGRQKLKGSGAISDFEFRVLNQAMSSLDKNLSNVDAMREIRKVRGVLSTAAGLTATVEIKDPITGESQIIESDRAGIEEAIIDGMLVEYK